MIDKVGTDDRSGADDGGDQMMEALSSLLALLFAASLNKIIRFIVALFFSVASGAIGCFIIE